MSVGHREINGKVSVDLNSVSFVHNEYIELLKPVYWQLLPPGNWCGGIGFFVGESASVQSWCWRLRHSGRNKVNFVWAGGERGGGKFWSVMALSQVTCRFRGWQLRNGGVSSAWENLCHIGHVS